MVIIKNKKEIQDLKKSSKILAEVKQIIYDAIIPGVSSNELDALAEKEIIKRGAKPAFKGYQGFTKTLCISFNEEMIHGIPSDRKVKNGDIIKIDAGCIYNGMYSDSAFTKVIGNIPKRDKECVDIAKKAFEAGLNAIKPGARIGDVSAAVGKVVHDAGFFVPNNFSGHGIGHSLHEEPYVYNEGVPNTGILLKDGMAICIEPMILQGTNEVEILKDGWTVISKTKKNTAHYEHTILIENGYPVVLTEGI